MTGHDQRGSNELGLLELLAEDFATFDRTVVDPGLWAVAVHRFGTRVDRLGAGPVRSVLGAVYDGLSTTVDWVWGINIPRTVELGRRVRLWHNGCMLLNARTIGNDVHIRHDTTFGPVRGTTTRPEALPVIEDRVDIGSGACVLGGVRVGHDSTIGANTVVMKDVPAHATVLGVPARVIPT